MSTVFQAIPPPKIPKTAFLVGLRGKIRPIRPIRQIWPILYAKNGLLWSCHHLATFLDLISQDGIHSLVLLQCYNAILCNVNFLEINSVIIKGHPVCNLSESPCSIFFICGEYSKCASKKKQISVDPIPNPTHRARQGVVCVSVTNKFVVSTTDLLWPHTATKNGNFGKLWSWER